MAKSKNTKAKEISIIEVRKEWIVASIRREIARGVFGAPLQSVIKGFTGSYDQMIDLVLSGRLKTIKII
jgi:hypothetical protein